MKKLKIYLDTSIWNFIFADDAPEKQEITKQFFSIIKKFEIYISDVVLGEVDKASEQKKKILKEIILKYNPVILDGDPEIERIANIYIKKEVIPKSKYDDALHIAFSTYYEMDILLSWNYKHLANFTKKIKVLSVNLNEGYDKPLELITPIEVIGNDE